MQLGFLRELLRVAKKGVMFTTPNRNHPIEPHTGLPFIHYLPQKAHHTIYSLLGKEMYASVDNLNLRRVSDIKMILNKCEMNTEVCSFKYTYWLGIPVNIVVIVDVRGRGKDSS